MADEDVGDCMAFENLRELVAAGIIDAATCDKYQGIYAKLHERVLKTYESEKTLLKDAKQLNQDLLGQKIKVEKAGIEKHESLQVVASLEAEREKGLGEVNEARDRCTVLQYEEAELLRECTELEHQVGDMKRANLELVEPELAKGSERISEVETQIMGVVKETEKESARKKDLVEEMTVLENSLVELEQLEVAEKSLLNKLRGDPDRVTKQATVIAKATDNLRMELDKLDAKLFNCETELQEQLLKKKEVGLVHRDLSRKLDLHRSTIEQRERDLEAVGKSLELEKNTETDLLAHRVSLELRLRSEKQKLKEQNSGLSMVNKEFDATKRLLKKRQMQLNMVAARVPERERSLADSVHMFKSYESAKKKQKKVLQELKQKVDILIATFLKLESLGLEEKQSLEERNKVIRKLETHISKWVAEENRQAKQLSLLTAQRDIKSRDAAKAKDHEKETKEDVRMKELILLDLAKKNTDTNNWLKEFSALYDVVKNERNKYVNLIQASSQALAEMKEKIKILQNEVEILRNESVAKDKALAKERLAHHTAQCQRDGARLETNKYQNIYKQKQETVEQQIVEIDKLNSIINTAERSMLSRKKQYETSVEHRNFIGVQLVDRNDELCILYEKSNIQMETLKKGELAIRAREEEIRHLQLNVKEVERKLHVQRKGSVADMPSLAKQILRLKRDLAHESDLTAKLCADLETPDNLDRWRALEGDDPDIEQLMAKVSILNERLNDKKEKLLEKDLVLEEVSALVSKLRVRADTGRDDTLELAKRMNAFQNKIKVITRKMKATISELSMYQATAMRLEQEKADREAALEDAQWRFDQNQSPSEEIHAEFLAHQRLGFPIATSINKLAGDPAPDKPTSDAMGQPVPEQVRTTALARPNAYLPEPFALPKPYGKHAPFKPTAPGSTMRHIRKPEESEIEI